MYIHNFLPPNWMQILTSIFNRQPFDQEGLTTDCNIIVRVIKDRKKQLRNTWKREQRKKKQTTPPASPQNKKCTYLYIETWIHNRIFEGHQCQSSIHNKTIAISTYIGDHLQSYFKLGRALWLEIRTCASVIREYSSSGYCSYVAYIHVTCSSTNFITITNQMHHLFTFILLQNSTCFGHLLSLYTHFYTIKVEFITFCGIIYCFNLYFPQDFTIHFNNTVHMYILIILPTYEISVWNLPVLNVQ